MTLNRKKIKKEKTEWEGREAREPRAVHTMTQTLPSDFQHRSSLNSSRGKRYGVLKTYQEKCLARETKNFLEVWLGRSPKPTEGDKLCSWLHGHLRGPRGKKTEARPYEEVGQAEGLVSAFPAVRCT